MRRPGSLLLLPVVLLALGGCEKPPPPPQPVKEEPPPRPPAPKVEAPKPPEPPRDVMVRLEGKLASKVKAAKYELYLSRRECEPAAATGQDLVGRIVPVPASMAYRLEIAVPTGVPIHLCALGLDRSGKVIGAAALPAPFTFSGDYGKIPGGLTVVAAKAKEASPRGTPPKKGGTPPKKGGLPRHK